MRFLLVFLFLLTGINAVNAQREATKKILVTGTITDSENKPIKKVLIYVDSVKTNVKTNKQGLYKIKLISKTKLITVFSRKHGVLNFNYSGEQKVNFMFPENNYVITERELSQLGYVISSEKENNKDQGYENYRDVFELFKSRFPNVQVVDQTVRIKGTGASITGSFAPIFLVNGTEVFSIASIPPSDIKSIVVERGKTSLYGSRGAGGVIKITLK